MGDLAGHADDERLAALDAHLHALQQQVEHLQVELATLRASRAPGPISPAGPAARARTERSGVSRRGMLLGAAGVAATGAVALVAAAAPAGANAQGGSLTLGDPTNTATAATGLTASLGEQPVLEVANGASGNYVVLATLGTTIPTGPAVTGAIVGRTTGAANALAGNASGTGSNGVKGVGDFGGWFEGDTVGAYGASDTGYAVLADSTSGTGVVASAGGTTGVGGSFSANGAVLNLTPASSPRGAPTTDAIAHHVGDLVADSSGNLWYCTGAGTPGTWRQLTGPATAGAFHVLPAPFRVYDSRVGQLPSTGPKTPLAPNTPRALSVTTGSGVPVGATAAVVNLLLVDAVAGNGNFTIWSNGVARPTGNSMVWGGTTGRFSSLAVTALSAIGACQVESSVQTDFVLDVVGYYR